MRPRTHTVAFATRLLRRGFLGDMITMDHANANALIHNRLAGDRELLIVSDLVTEYLGAYPVGPTSAGWMVIALVHFLGHDVPKVVHTDGAPEFGNSIRNLLGRASSQDGRPRYSSDKWCCGGANQ